MLECTLIQKNNPDYIYLAFNRRFCDDTKSYGHLSYSSNLEETTAEFQALLEKLQQICHRVEIRGHSIKIESNGLPWKYFLPEMFEHIKEFTGVSLWGEDFPIYYKDERWTYTEEVDSFDYVSKRTPIVLEKIDYGIEFATHENKPADSLTSRLDDALQAHFGKGFTQLGEHNPNVWGFVIRDGLLFMAEDISYFGQDGFRISCVQIRGDELPEWHDCMVIQQRIPPNFEVIGATIEEALQSILNAINERMLEAIANRAEDDISEFEIDENLRHAEASGDAEEEEESQTVSSLEDAILADTVERQPN